MKPLLLLACLALSVPAATVKLHQGGWTDGTSLAGPLTISFTGEDANSDGGYETSELTAFSGAFLLPGGGVVSLALSHLDPGGFYYASPADLFMNISGPDYTLYEIAGPTGSVALFTADFETYISGDLLAPVPEPSTAFFLGGAAILLTLRHLKARSRVN